MVLSPLEARARGRLLRLGLPAIAFFLAAGVVRGLAEATPSHIQLFGFAILAAVFEAGRLAVGRKPSLAGWTIDTGAAAVAILLVKVSLEGL